MQYVIAEVTPDGYFRQALFEVVHNVDPKDQVCGFGPDSTVDVAYRGSVYEFVEFSAREPYWLPLHKEATDYYFPRVVRAFEEFAKTQPEKRTKGVRILVIPVGEEIDGGPFDSSAYHIWRYVPRDAFPIELPTAVEDEE